MPEYRRRLLHGGTYFFTVVTARRQPILCQPTARRLLHDAIEGCRQQSPFEIVAMVLLPEHLHALWTLPPADSDYSSRWSRIKARFTSQWLSRGGDETEVSAAKQSRRQRGVWQPRFHEHTIRDEDDLESHFHYLHYNPVKHGLCGCPHEWGGTRHFTVT